MFNLAKIVGLKCLIARLLIIEVNFLFPVLSNTDLVLVVSLIYPTHRNGFGLSVLEFLTSDWSTLVPILLCEIM